jgi:hypothetical protein
MGDVVVIAQFPPVLMKILRMRKYRNLMPTSNYVDQHITKFGVLYRMTADSIKDAIQLACGGPVIYIYMLVGSQGWNGKRRALPVLIKAPCALSRSLVAGSG